MSTPFLIFFKKIFIFADYFAVADFIKLFFFHILYLPASKNTGAVLLRFFRIRHTPGIIITVPSILLQTVSSREAEDAPDKIRRKTIFPSRVLFYLLYYTYTV